MADVQFRSSQSGEKAPALQAAVLRLTKERDMLAREVARLWRELRSRPVNGTSQESWTAADVDLGEGRYRFLTLLTHELRTPLAGVMGLCGICLPLYASLWIILG